MNRLMSLMRSVVWVLMVGLLLPLLGCEANAVQVGDWDRYERYVGQEDTYVDPSVRGRPRIEQISLPRDEAIAKLSESRRLRAEQVQSRALAAAPPMASDALANPIGGIEVQSAQQEQATARQVIYTGTVTIAVADVQASVDFVRGLAESLGGHMQNLNGESITVRVPAERFDSVIERVQQLGELRNKSINAQDVTQQFQDVEIQLKTARTAYDRLIALLEKAEKTEDVVTIERELRRLKTEIDRIEGRQRYLSDQVTLATLTVRFNAKVPQEPTERPIPIRWLGELAFELLNPAAQPPMNERFGHGVSFELPEDFIRHYQRDYVTMAMAPGDMGLKVIRHANYDSGSQAFWVELVRDTLIDRLGIPMSPAKSYDVDMKKLWSSDTTGMAFMLGSKKVGAEPYGYLIGVVATDRYVYTFEAWGPEETMTAQREAILASMTSMRVR